MHTYLVAVLNARPNSMVPVVMHEGTPRAGHMGHIMAMREENGEPRYLIAFIDKHMISAGKSDFHKISEVN